MECLGEGPGLGSDEQGCDGDAGTPAPSKQGSTQEAGTKKEMYTERNHDRDFEKLKVMDNSQSSERSEERDPDSDLWAEEEAVADQDQPPTHKELAVMPSPIEWPCGGLLQTFYGTFSPPANRGTALLCVWTLDPQDSRPLRLDFQQLVLGPRDRLTIFNREQGQGDVIKIVSLFDLDSFLIIVSKESL